MNIIRRLTVPTGDIYVVDGEHGPLEVLSLGDYGRDVNLNQHRPVPDGLRVMPLTEKWVVTVSTQYGCSMGCEFCDVPKVGPGRNATVRDIASQVATVLTVPGAPTHTKRLNIHFARMGEPTWNPAVLEYARFLANQDNSNMPAHPVVSTMMPRRNKWLHAFIWEWMRIKNELFAGNAGLQLSINSTDWAERDRMFAGNACNLFDIAHILRDVPVLGRKITLNFCVANYHVDPLLLADLFPPHNYIVKLTPTHKTAAAAANGIATPGDYTAPEPYLELEAKFKAAGYETLTFIASRDEDEGRITCGNAILSGSLPIKFTEHNS